ncbi:group 1 glycosyl transferase [Bacillus freudenreichii]|nr:group 1 glycosyl transferase [Bacillus freudenreichii]
MEKGSVPIRILHVVSSMGRGGAETLIMNIYRNIDRKRVQFDFVTHGNEAGGFDAEIKSMGGKIYKIPSLGTSGPYRYVKNLMGVMAGEGYAAVHIHTDYQGGLPALAAKLSGIKRRICHSHCNNWPQNGPLKNILLSSLRLMIRLFATHLCSCSYEAAEFLFGKKALQNNRVSILKNGINLDEFLNDCQEERAEVLKELRLDEGVKIIGHVGRFSESKNQLFILKVLKELLKSESKFVAVFIGDGPVRERVEREAVQLGLSEYVRFMGIRDDIPRFMKAFDVFLFPSLFEGFGIVMLEAQSSGVPCVASTAVPKSTDMGLGLVNYLNLKHNFEKWIQTIQVAVSKKKPSKAQIEQNITARGFNIRNNTGDWLLLYGLSNVLSLENTDGRELGHEKRYIDHLF